MLVLIILPVMFNKKLRCVSKLEVEKKNVFFNLL